MCPPGVRLEAPIRAILSAQKDKLHQKAESGAPGGNILSAVFEKFVLAMVISIYMCIFLYIYLGIYLFIYIYLSICQTILTMSI